MMDKLDCHCYNHNDKSHFLHSSFSLIWPDFHSRVTNSCIEVVAETEALEPGLFGQTAKSITHLEQVAIN